MEITLYRGTQEFTAELDVDQETGEIAATCPLDVLVQRNPIGTAAFVLNTMANASMIDAHIKLMQAKKNALTSNAERAKQALLEVMQATGVLSIKSDDGTFKAVLSKGANKSVEVFDENQIPADYMREIPASYAPDKALMTKAIKDGYQIPGARLVENDRLTIK